MRKFFHGSVLYCLISLIGCKGITTPDTSGFKNSYKLIFEANFDEDQIDTSIWMTSTASPKPYDKVLPRTNCDFTKAAMLLPENIVVADGNLNLIAKREDYVYKGIAGGKADETLACDFQGQSEFEINLNYTSASITSKTGYNHAYFECRAKIPATIGLYPVFWLWHHDEIVVFEFFGNPQEHFVSAHNKEKYDSEKFNVVNNYSDAFHTYAVDWKPEVITWYFDEIPIKTIYKYLDKSTGEGIVEINGQNKNDFVINTSFPDSENRWLSPNLSLRIYEWAEYVADAALPDTLIIDYLKIYENLKK